MRGEDYGYLKVNVKFKIFLSVMVNNTSLSAHFYCTYGEGSF